MEVDDALDDIPPPPAGYERRVGLHDLSIGDVPQHNEDEALLYFCNLFTARRDLARRVTSLGFCSDDGPKPAGGMFPISKSPRLPQLLTLLPSVGDLYFSGIYFGIMPNLQLFFDAIEDMDQVHSIKLAMPHTHLADLWGFMDAARMSTTERNLTLSNVHIFDFDPILARMGLDGPSLYPDHSALANEEVRWANIDPPVIDVENMDWGDLEGYDYDALAEGSDPDSDEESPEKMWKLLLELKNPCDHILMDVLACRDISPIAPHSLCALDIDCPFLSVNVVQRVNNLIHVSEFLDELFLDFGETNIFQDLPDHEDLPLLNTQTIRNLDFNLGTINDGRTSTNTSLLLHWLSLNLQAHLRPASKLKHVALTLRFENLDNSTTDVEHFGLQTCWEMLDHVLHELAVEVLVIHVPITDYEESKEAYVAKFVEWNLPRIRAKYWADRPNGFHGHLDMYAFVPAFTYGLRMEE